MNWGSSELRNHWTVGMVSDMAISFPIDEPAREPRLVMPHLQDYRRWFHECAPG